MVKRLLVSLIVFLGFFASAQCPLVYNYLGTPTSQPLFISCTGSVYALNFQASSSFGTYTLNWGDASANNTGSSYTANSVITHTYAAAVNSFVMVLNIPSQSCSMTGTVVIEKQVNASIQIPTLGVTTACAPKTLTFTNSSTDVSPTTTFTWSFGDGSPPVVTSFTNAGNNITHQYLRGTVNCQTQVTLLAKNYCSFGNPTQANFNPISIYDTDSAIITVDKMLRCMPDNVFSFTNGSIRNCLSQGNTFQRQERWNFGDYWSLGHDSIIGWRPWPPSTPISIAYPGIGSYNVVLQDSNLCGVTSRTLSVIITSAPNASLIVPSATLCQNTAVTFTNASSPGFSYRWDFGTGSGFQNLGSGNKTFTYTTAGTYTVRLMALINNAGGACSDTAYATVNVLPSPTASFAATPTAGCNSLNNVVFTDLSSNAISYNWSFGNGNTSTLSAPPAQNYTVVGAIIPTLNVTSASGCVKSFTRSLIVRPNPVPAFTQFTTCVGATVTLANNSAVSGTNAINSYTWNLGDGSAASTSTAPVHTYTAPGTYTVKLIAATAFCLDSIKLPVTINVKPTASFVISPTVACPPFTVAPVNTSSFATNYAWRFGTSPTAVSNATNPTYVYTNTTQSFQNYTITLVASTGSGCADSVKKAVSVRPSPVANFTANTLTGCSPLATTFSNTTIGATQHAWTFGDGGTSTAVNPTHTFTNLTLFTQTVSTRLVVTNSVSCTDSIRQTITIYPEALPTFTVNPSIGCGPLHVNFPSVPGIATYTWNHGDGSPTFTTVNSHTYTYANTTTTSIVYTVNMVALTSNGCIGSNSQTVTVYANPQANFVFTPTAACSPATVSFSNGSVNNMGNRWNFGNGLVSVLTDPTATFGIPAGTGQTTFTVKLVVNTNNNCKDSLTRTMTIFPLPKALFTADTPACSPRVLNFTNNSLNGFTYKWDFGDGGVSTSSNPAHPFVNNTPFGKYFAVKLLAISANNCRDSLTVQTAVHPKPNYFITSSPDSGCSPVKVFFQKISGVSKYEWKYDNISFGSSGDINNTFENKTTNTKTYQIELIASDQFGCQDTATKTIKVFPIPEAKYSISPLTVYVPNQVTQFANLSTSALTYTWTFGDGNKSTAYSPQHTYASAGEYSTSLIITNNKGCKDTFSLPEKVLALNETTVIVPNAFTPSTGGPKGGHYDPKDLSNDVFYPSIKGTERYQFSVYSRWGELLFETRDPEEGWDGYYRGKLCTQDVYIWKINATFIDGRTYNKTGDLLLLR